MQQVTRLNNNTTHHCIHEERLTNIEVDIAELKTRMDNKKDDIHSINKELVHDRQQQIELIEKVTEVTVLLKAGQEQREANNRKFEDLEKKVDKLQEIELEEENITEISDEYKKVLIKVLKSDLNYDNDDLITLLHQYKDHTNNLGLVKKLGIS